MIIRESSNYKKSYKKNLVNKYKDKEIERIKIFIGRLESYNNLQDFMNSSDKARYYVEQKKQNLKEIFAARIYKIRLIFKPISEYPYNYIEIDEIELLEVNDDHYKNL